MNKTAFPKPLIPWLRLLSRSALFLSFQCIIALVLFGLGRHNAWDHSIGWWLYTVFSTNFASVLLLVYLYKTEGENYWAILHISKSYSKDGSALAAWRHDHWYTGPPQ